MDTLLTVDSLLRGLSWLDRLLAPLVLIAMILGVVIGESPSVERY
jgi:ACR3 family arsenite efflux pump ArsB